jgi:hypothetical protein
MAVYKIKWDDASSRSAVQGGLARSRREDSPNLSGVETLWPVVRLHMANEAINGEVFLQPLSSIREILERSNSLKTSSLMVSHIASGQTWIFTKLSLVYCTL